MRRRYFIVDNKVIYSDYVNNHNDLISLDLTDLSGFIIFNNLKYRYKNTRTETKLETSLPYFRNDLIFVVDEFETKELLNNRNKKLNKIK